MKLETIHNHRPFLSEMLKKVNQAERKDENTNPHKGMKST